MNFKIVLICPLQTNSQSSFSFTKFYFWWEQINNYSIHLFFYICDNLDGKTHLIDNCCWCIKPFLYSCLRTIFWFIKFRGIQKAIQKTYHSHCLSSESWKYIVFHQGQLLSLLEEVFKKVPMQPMQWCNICIIKSLNAVFILYIITHTTLSIKMKYDLFWKGKVNLSTIFPKTT